jgi:flagellar hook assembly protein FlgD
MGGALGQSMPTMPANHSLPHYPPLEISGPAATGHMAESESDKEDQTAVVTNQLALLGIAPNPFNPMVQIDFTVPAESRSVSLTIHGVNGRLVCRLVENEYDEGTHTVTWRGRDDGGRRLPSGVYIARLHAGGEVIMRKMLLIQ